MVVSSNTLPSLLAIRAVLCPDARLRWLLGSAAASMLRRGPLSKQNSRGKGEKYAIEPQKCSLQAEYSNDSQNLELGTLPLLHAKGEADGAVLEERFMDVGGR